MREEEQEDKRGAAIRWLGRLRQIVGGRGMALLLRGESQWFEEVSSRLWREHRAAGIWPSDAGLDFMEVEDRIAGEVQKFTGETTRSKTEIIDELEIAGGKTNQINFTFDVSIAVWFACQEPNHADGRVILVPKNAVTMRFPKRGYAPRQAPVLVSDREGRIAEKAIVAIEKVPAELKDELLSVIARTDGLWLETVFSGRIQTVMGFVRMKERSDTSAITKQEIDRKKEDAATERGLVEAAKYFAVQRPNRKNTTEGETEKERSEARETVREIVIRPREGTRQDELVGLRGNIWMDSGRLYRLNVGGGSDGRAARLGGKEETGASGLVHLRMPGWRTQNACRVTVGEATEIELVRWQGGDGRRETRKVDLTFRTKQAGP